MHFKSIATFLAKSANEKKSVRSTKGASAECELSVDHITITCTLAGRRLGAGMQHLASAGPQLQHECGGAYWQTKALQTSRLSPNSHLFPNRAITAKRRPAVLSTVRKVWMVRSTGAGARKRFERIVCRRRDMQRLIPFHCKNHASSADGPPPCTSHTRKPGLPALHDERCWLLTAFKT